MQTSMLLKTSFMAAAGAALVTFGATDSASALNLVQNGGFETGNFTGWTQSGNTGFTSVSSILANSGDFAARLGPIGSRGFLSQILPTVEGQRYQLSYFLASDGGTPNLFQTFLSGLDGSTTLANLTNIPSQGFNQYTFEFIGTGVDTLTFGFRNDPGYLTLDDVSVAAVPVPTPALLPGLLGMGVAVLRKRKGEAAKEASEA